MRRMEEEWEGESQSGRKKKWQEKRTKERINGRIEGWKGDMMKEGMMK